MILIAPFLALRLPWGNRIINLTALVLPLAAALIFYIWLSYARFGNITGVHFDYYIDTVHSEFAHKFGVFSPRRLPYSFADYFSLRFPSLQREPPYLAANRHSYDYPSLFSNDFSEVYLPLPWCSAWLVFGAIMGITCLVRRHGAAAFERGAAVALFAQFLCILSYFLLAERYAADLYPFLIFCLIIFLGSEGVALFRSRHVMIGLIALSVVVNSLATVSWLVDYDMNVPTETRAKWKQLLGRKSPLDHLTGAFDHRSVRFAVTILAAKFLRVSFCCRARGADKLVRSELIESSQNPSSVGTSNGPTDVGSFDR